MNQLNSQPFSIFVVSHFIHKVPLIILGMKIVDLTAQTIAVCLMMAAQVTACRRRSGCIYEVEGGQIGQVVGNTNGSYDIGPMQINTLWVPELARHWGVSEKQAFRMLRDDPCINTGVFADLTFTS